MVVQPLGEHAFVATLGGGGSGHAEAKVLAAAEALRREPLPGLVDVVPAYASLALFFRRGALPAESELSRRLAALSAAGNPDVPMSTERRTLEIPVAYGGGEGPDLAAVAAHTQLSPEDVVRLHSAATYTVQAIGFLPGFPYLAGLPDVLACPRRATPRPRVPAGSVGIGGAQTGVYPCASPGGWNLIGQTSRRLFDAARAEPALLRAGDRVRFTAVPRMELPDAVADAVPAGEVAIRVLRAGLQSSVQDLGREGWRAAGVGCGGAADEMAARIANLLVGNPEGAAGIEFTLTGPELRFERDAWIAVGGGEFAGVPSWTPHLITAGSTLRIGEARRGSRGFLAVAGGIAVESVLGSRSVHLRAGFGGGFGRALRAGDGLPVGSAPGGGPRGKWRIDPRLLPRYSAEAEVRLITTPESGPAADAAAVPWFAVSPRSDRMGVRFEGEPLPGAWSGERVSSPVAPGTVQVPPDGRPIALLTDAQTIGGYPVVGQVAAVDLPVLAQLRPGERLRFRPIALAEARERLATREQGLAMLREGLKERWA